MNLSAETVAELRLKLEALGGNVPARIKKAELIEAIERLQATGATGGGGGAVALPDPSAMNVADLRSELAILGADTGGYKARIAAR